MQRIPVDSTTLASIGYDEPTQTLELEFRTGELYRYSEVPPERYRALLEADSKGRFFNRQIRDLYQCLHLKRSRTATQR